MPRVTVIVLGGTITMVPQASGGIAPSLSGSDLIEAVPALSGIADIEVVTPFLVPGASLSFRQLAIVGDMILSAGQKGANGVVVVQGTDTIDETSFLLDLCLEATPDSPAIVVTGAMRGAAAPGADGHGNLLSAVIVAASPKARGLGTLVVLNDEVHAARFVQKMDTSLPSAFASPGLGPIGTVVEGAFRPRQAPVTVSLPMLSIADAAPVAVVQTGLGDEGQLIEHCDEFGYQGAVIVAMGAGHVPATLANKLEALVLKMPVVLSTRVPGGAIFTSTYGFEGSEIDLLGRGLIPAGLLPAHKARLLLACLLGGGFTSDEIRAQFQAFS